LNTADAEYAGPGRRLAALMIDIILVAAIIAGGLLAWVTIGGKTPDSGSRAFHFTAGGIALFILILKVTLDGWLQGTPGLRLMDCRLVDIRSGLGIGLLRSVKRTLGLIVAILPVLLGLLWMFWNKRRQGWHDLLAGSVVIREDEALKSVQQLAREAL
jgi:uncharacterized RDD family membrane protein YckC